MQMHEHCRLHFGNFCPPQVAATDKWHHVALACVFILSVSQGPAHWWGWQVEKVLGTLRARLEALNGPDKPPLHTDDGRQSLGSPLAT